MMDPYELCCLPLPGPGLMELGYGMFVNSPLLSYRYLSLRVLFLYLPNQIVDDRYTPLIYIYIPTYLYKGPSTYEREIQGI